MGFEIILVAVLLVLFALVKLWAFEQEKKRRLEKAEKLLRERPSTGPTVPNDGPDEDKGAEGRKTPVGAEEDG